MSDTKELIAELKAHEESTKKSYLDNKEYSDVVLLEILQNCLEVVDETMTKDEIYSKAGKELFEVLGGEGGGGMVGAG